MCQDFMLQAPMLSESHKQICRIDIDTPVVMTDQYIMHPLGALRSDRCAQRQAAIAKYSTTYITACTRRTFRSVLTTAHQNCIIL